MMIGLIIGMMAGYGYGAPPAPNSNPGASGSGLDTKPFVQLQRKCFDQAVAETSDATTDVKQQRFDACFKLHDAMVKRVTGKLSEKEAAGVKHEIDHALIGVEKTYAKKLGVVMPGDTMGH